MSLILFKILGTPWTPEMQGGANEGEPHTLCNPIFSIGLSHAVPCIKSGVPLVLGLQAVKNERTLTMRVTKKREHQWK
jgi:hypothetical protein